MHRLRKSRWARSSQCPLDSTPLPPSPWMEYQYKYSTPSTVSEKIVSTCMCSGLRVSRTACS